MKEQNIYSIFAANLTRLLNMRGLSQVDVANALNVSESAVSLWCSGKTAPRLSKISELCQVLCCSVASLFVNQSQNKNYETHPISKVLVKMDDDQLSRLQEYAEFLVKSKG